MVNPAMSELDRKQELLAPPFLLSVVLYLLLRFLFFDADPVPMDFSISAFGDGGYYSHNPRSFALFGCWTECRWLVTPIFPAYHVPLAGWFLLLGDSLLTLRLFHVLVHALGLAGTVIAVDRTWGRRAARWTAFLWCVSWVTIAASRNAWVDNILLAYLGLGFAATVALPATAAGFCGGLLLGLAVAAKPYALAFLPGFLWAQGRDKKHWLALGLGFLVVVAPYAYGWWRFSQSDAETYRMTISGIFVGRENTGAADVLRRFWLWPEIFATTFFARMPVETLLALSGTVYCLRKGSWSIGERFLLGSLVGLSGMYFMLDQRTIRYYLLLLIVMMPMAALFLTRIQVARELALAKGWLSHLLRAGMAFVLGLMAVWVVMMHGLAQRPGIGLWLLAGVALAAILYPLLLLFWRLRVRAPRQAAALLVALALLLSATQYALWRREATSQQVAAARQLARLHPPARVCGWIAPEVGLGTPHHIYWDWGKPDSPDYYVPLYGCEYLWSWGESSDTRLASRLVGRMPCDMGRIKKELFVYDLRGWGR